MSVPPSDPLGPVAQDPDVVRTAACKLVSSDVSCTVTSVRPPDQPHSPSAVSAGVDLVTLGFWILLFAVLVLVIVLVARAVARRQSRRADEAPDDDAISIDDDGATAPRRIDRRREPRDWRQDADRHRAAGRFRDALRCRYRALVGDLARGGVIDEIPGRTTGEERAQMADVVPVAAPAFDRAADLFDAVWYGDVPAGGDDVDVFAELERTVLDAATRQRR